MSESQFWLNSVIDEVESTYPEGEIIVSSGISPSASYHLGHFREILTADLVAWGLKQRGRKVRHLHVVDNFDPLRKRYEFLPEEYEKYVGWPVCLVPDPEKKYESYAERFFQEFFKYVKELNVEVEVIDSYKDLYKTGKMAQQIEACVEKVDQIKKIFSEVANRKLSDDWMPLQLLSDNNSFNEWKFKGIDTKTKEIIYTDGDNDGKLKYNNGRVKLNWRLDWPARWQVLGVMVEPHGFQEHGASGGSYETGIRFAKEVFGFEPPIAAVQYGHIHLAGDNIKMSSSKGNVVTPAQAFEIMPPEMIRYIYARYTGKKRIDFDPGLGLFRLMDEFAAVDRAIAEGQEHEFASAYNYAIADQKTPGMSSVPFSHLVNIYQAALGDRSKIYELLERSGYEKEAKDQKQAIDRQLDYAKNWLDKWAPDEVKFELQKQLPEVDLSESQKAMLGELAQMTEKAESNAEWFHTAIHDLKEKHDLSASEAFAAIYLVLLNRKAGPKAGLFLSILEKDWLIKRLKEASA